MRARARAAKAHRFLLEKMEEAVRIIWCGDVLAYSKESLLPSLVDMIDMMRVVRSR